MKKIFKYGAFAAGAVVVAAALYGGKGYMDAKAAGTELAQRADKLIADGRGGNGLTEDQLKTLVLVQDPGFYAHNGVDLSTKGAGITTMTQSLSKRVGFENFKPGIGKIRQTGFAMGLETVLSKDQIVALFLDTVEMGRGPDGWMTGFFTASDDVYQKPVSALSDDEFTDLVAVMIAPSRYKLGQQDADLAERRSRIQKLSRGECEPRDNGDVWLEGCA